MSWVKILGEGSNKKICGFVEIPRGQKKFLTKCQNFVGGRVDLNTKFQRGATPTPTTTLPKCTEVTYTKFIIYNSLNNVPILNQLFKLDNSNS
jgi:hypothetical protein